MKQTTFRMKNIGIKSKQALKSCGIAAQFKNEHGQYIVIGETLAQLKKLWPKLSRSPLDESKCHLVLSVFSMSGGLGKRKGK